MICPRNPYHGTMAKNGTRADRQLWRCLKCGASGTTKKEVEGP